MEFKSVATKRGDEGETDSFGKGRISKEHIAIEAVGKLDLLQAEMGMALALMSDAKYDFIKSRFEDLTREAQAAIFALNGDVISLPTQGEKLESFFKVDVLQKVENHLNDIEKGLPPIQNFCYPAGDLVACALHKVRAVCRETEIVLVKYNRTCPLPEGALPFINRLSDLLFVLARWVNIKLGFGDDLWKNVR